MGAAGSRGVPRRDVSTLGVTLLVAVGVVLGAQLLRVALPSIGWYLGDSIDLSTYQMLPYAVAPFALSLLAPLLARFIGPGRLLVASGIGLAVVRVAEQVSVEPAVDLWLSLTGLVCFFWFVASVPARYLALGLLLGLGADTALKGLTGTLDLSWIDGWWPIIVVVALAAVFGVLLWRAQPVSGRSGGIALVGVGPLLLVHWLILQNQGLMVTLTGWPSGVALLAITLGNVLAMAGVVSLRGVPAPIFAILLAPAVLLLDAPPVTFALGAMVALAASGPLLAGLASREGHAGSVALGAGWLFFMALTFTYYAGLDLRLPLARELVPLVAVGLVLLASLSAIRPEQVMVERRAEALLAVPLLLAAAALIGADVMRPTVAVANAYPVTVMNYNIHSAYGKSGRQNVEEIARVIEDSGADLVGLQEVGRGWLLSGSTDVVTLLANRLKMPFTAFYGTSDPLWGLAVLSRYPILEVEHAPLPVMEALIGRGYQAVTVDLGEGEELTLYNTHLSQLRNPAVFDVDPQRDLEELHIAQVDVILDAWTGRPRGVLVGDLNAPHEWAEVQRILEAGWVDAWEAGEGPGYTSDAANPYQRIDWIFHTPDLAAESAFVPQTLASDHLPVVATLRPAD
jgi:endonuclease/exonuclease/phosphatase family metal-dependent hydrolase